MTPYLKLSVLLLATALLLGSCQQQHQKAETVKITLTDAISFSDTFKINRLSLLNFAPTTLAEAQADSTGTIVLEFALSSPSMLYLEADELSGSLYLTPGDELQLSMEGHRPEKPNYYSGSGAAANNYLIRSSLLRARFDTLGGEFMFDLSPEAFLSRLDSMKVAFAAFHRHYTDSLAIPAEVASLLEKHNAIELLALKQNVTLIHQDNPDLPQALQEVSKEIPFDSYYLNTGMLGYGILLHMYLDAKIYRSHWDGKTPEEMVALDEQLPALAEQDILKGQYPAAIQDYLRARNILYSLELKGINPTLDSLLTNFKKEHPTSAYLPALEQEHTKWLALAPGTAAPDIKGTSPEGKAVTLSQFKGKVVYVDIWATWCGPCRQEFPHAKVLQKTFAANDDVAFLYVSVDDDLEAWKKMLAEISSSNGIHMIAEGRWNAPFMKAYQVRGVPRYILIDKDGNIAKAKAAKPSSGIIQGEIEALLAKGKVAML